MPSVHKTCPSAARLAVLVALGLLAARGVALAQIDEARIGPFAVDVRGTFGAYGPTPEQAALIGYADTDLPSHGWGVDAGAHWYPLKWRAVTLGIGGTVLLTAGHKSPEDEKGVPTGREADTRFRSVASQISFNFGGGAGWSYVSGGLGYSTFAISNEAFPQPDSLPKRKTTNFGGGARWSLKAHLALTLDLRFYRVAALAASDDVPGDAGTTRVVVGAGVAYK